MMRIDQEWHFIRVSVFIIWFSQLMNYTKLTSIDRYLITHVMLKCQYQPPTSNAGN